MGGFSIRAIFFVLALAFQAIAASAAGVAETRPGSDSSIYAQHCGIGGAGDKGAPSNHRRHHHHDCLLCQSCAGAAAPVAFFVSDAYLIDFREMARLRFGALEFVARPTIGAQAHRARAPPVFS